MRNNINLTPKRRSWQRLGKSKRILSTHPELLIRTPESTSAARAAGFNKQDVSQFFNFLGNIYDEHKLSLDRIYNCDSPQESDNENNNIPCFYCQGK